MFIANCQMAMLLMEERCAVFQTQDTRVELPCVLLYVHPAGK